MNVPGDDDEYNARLRLNQPPQQQQNHFLPTFEIVHAARDGNLEKVRDCIARHADVKRDDSKALRLAVSYGHLEVAQALLRAGAEADVKRGSNLELAAETGNAQMVELLCEWGADANRDDGRALRRAALHGHTETVMALVAAGADVFAFGSSAYKLAVEEKHDMVAAFLDSVMQHRRAQFLEKMAAAENVPHFMRTAFSTSAGKFSECGLVYALRAGCLDAALAKMKGAGDGISVADLKLLRDGSGRSLQQLAKESGELLKLFDPALWRGDIGAMQEAWVQLPRDWFDKNEVDYGALQKVVFDFRQTALKAKAPRFKI